MSQRPASFGLSVFVLALCGLAQNPAANPPVGKATAPVVFAPAKIAFVDILQAITACEEGKLESAAWQQFVNTKNAELQTRQKDVEALRNQLGLQVTKLTDDARVELADQIEIKDTDLERFKQDTQKEIERRRLRFQNAIGRKMVIIIGKLAKEKGLSAVQSLDQTRDLFVDPALFITDDLIQAYNQAFPTPATAPTPPNKK